MYIQYVLENILHMKRKIKKVIVLIHINVSMLFQQIGYKPIITTIMEEFIKLISKDLINISHYIEDNFYKYLMKYFLLIL